MCQIIYGYEDLSDRLKEYYILDPTGFQNYKRKIAFDLNFKLQRENAEKLRSLYFTIFELSSIMRELNFRMISPYYALPSIIGKLNTSLPLTWKSNEVTLKDPVTIESQTDFDENVETSVVIDLYQFTGVKNFELKSKVKIYNKKIEGQLNISLKLENKGLKQEVNEKELNNLLRVVSKEVNQKAMMSQSALDEISENLIQSMIEPLVEKRREELERKTGFSDFIYIPADRSLLLNASESALTDEEIVQLFSDKCIFALNRLKEGKKNFQQYFSDAMSREGMLYWNDKSLLKAPYSVKSLAVIDAILSTAKGKSLIVIEYPELYLKEEEVDEIIPLLKKLDQSHELILITGNKKIVNECKNDYMHNS